MNTNKIHEKVFAIKLDELIAWVDTCPYDIDIYEIFTEELLTEKATELADMARDDYFDSLIETAKDERMERAYEETL